MEMYTDLMTIFTCNKVKCALMQMHPTKAPRLDWLSLAFFQDDWNVVGTQLINTCLVVLNKGTSISNLNHTVVVLIPKVNNPKRITEYCIISL